MYKYMYVNIHVIMNRHGHNNIRNGIVQSEIRKK